MFKYVKEAFSLFVMMLLVTRRYKKSMLVPAHWKLVGLVHLPCFPHVHVVAPSGTRFPTQPTSSSAPYVVVSLMYVNVASLTSQVEITFRFSQSITVKVMLRIRCRTMDIKYQMKVVSSGKLRWHLTYENHILVVV